MPSRKTAKGEKGENRSSSFLAQQQTVNSLTLPEKLDAIRVIFSVLSNTFLSLLTALYRRKSRGRRNNAFRKYISNTILRTVTRRASPRLLHYLSSPTDEAYAAFCKKAAVQPRSEWLEDGTVAHWIGDPKAEVVVVNFHGGGYVLPAMVEMFWFYHQLVRRVAGHGKSAAVLFLSYDLAPTAPYPRQLTQATALLNHIFRNLSISPSNVILTGDSAGANLLLAVLSHITHPHPQVTVLQLSAPFRGAVLISPWASFRTTSSAVSLPSPTGLSHSFEAYHYLDSISPDAINAWSGAFLGGKESDNYSEPVIAPSTWWAKIPNLVRETLIVYGADERLGDGIREFIEKFKAGFVSGETSSDNEEEELESRETMTFSARSRDGFWVGKSIGSSVGAGPESKVEVDVHVEVVGVPRIDKGKGIAAREDSPLENERGADGEGGGNQHQHQQQPGGERKLTIVEVPGEYHDEMFLDFQSNEAEEGMQARGIKEWILRRL